MSIMADEFDEEYPDATPFPVPPDADSVTRAICEHGWLDTSDVEESRHGDQSGEVYSSSCLPDLRLALQRAGFDICTKAERKVLDLAPDVASNFGRARSAELEIEFMRAVNNVLACRQEKHDV